MSTQERPDAPSGTTAATTTPPPGGATAVSTHAPAPSRVPAALVGVAVVVGVAGALVGLAHRHEQVDATTTVLLAVASALSVAAAAADASLARRPGGLHVPQGVRLPSPRWWVAPGLVGLADLGGGAAASPVMAVVGLLFIAAALVGLGLTLASAQQRGTQAPASVVAQPARSTVTLARRILATCGPQPSLTSLRVGAKAGIRVIATGRDSRVEDVVADEAQLEMLAALVGAGASETASR